MASFGLTDRLRSYAPDGDGYADQYATDMIDAATDLELMYKQVRELRQQLADCQKDAERYRWFREVLPNVIFDSMTKEIYLRKSLSLRDWTWTGEQLDDAIDAAMKETK